MIYTKESFPALASQPARLYTWFIRLFFAFWFGLLEIALCFFPSPLFMLKAEISFGKIAFLMVYYSIIIWITWKAFQSLKKDKGSRTITKILVDQQGIHYCKLDGSVDAVLYAALEKTDDSGRKDVCVKVEPGRYTKYFLCVIHSGRERNIIFNSLNIFFNFYVKNQNALRIRFLQGIKIFRPDLAIDPCIYSEYCIDPQTFEFQ